MNAKLNAVVKIKKGMCGLKQAVILVDEQLSERFQAAGYRPIIARTGIWKRETRQIIFCLCVDDLGVKYFSDSDTKHLLQTLENITSTQSIGQEEAFVDAHLIRTTKRDMWMFQYQDI